MNRTQGQTGNLGWQELYDENGDVRSSYESILSRLEGLSPSQLRNLRENIEATLREMGVTFNAGGPEQIILCDILPHVFAQQEWERVERGVKQRLQAFECLLQDVYGAKEILRSGVLPTELVLGSPHYQRASIGLTKPKDAYLHLSGLCLIRDKTGALLVKHHHFAHASGLSYMMQNRRALARVVPELLEEVPVQALADAPLALLESLRMLANVPETDISVVLLSPGPGSAVYSEHSFLARRMGIPVVQGGDLLVLNDCVYLKTVQGLERVEVIYNRLADQWLDPLVFKRNSLVGVPGLMHCARKGTVSLVNAVGSQLADDRSLLPFANRIIRFYTGEQPILGTMPTYWLGEIDQREMVLEDPERYEIRELFIDGLSGGDICAKLDPQNIRRQANRFVAQPRGLEATAGQFASEAQEQRNQEHIVFALRQGADFEVFPGALTRLAAPGRTDFEGKWSSRDTWVLGSGVHLLSSRNTPQPVLIQQKVTSRVAEEFYWLGRYLERAYDQAYLIQVIETLETEELNSAERKLYRPMWNRLLPPLEKSAGTSRRSITNRIDRYELMLLPEPGSVVSILHRAFQNAGSVLECLSPEAWAILNDLDQCFKRQKYRKNLKEQHLVRATRRMGEMVTRMVPQFFATASATMLADDGWKFCRIGQLLEKGIITANAVASVSKSLVREAHTTEIELSAFLRLLATRDAYRRAYQTRAEAVSVLEFLWQNAQAPRSVYRCLQECALLLRDSASGDLPGATKSLHAIDELSQQIKRVNWSAFVGLFGESSSESQRSRSSELEPLLNRLLELTLELHTHISDGFLSHQANIAHSSQPMLKGFLHGV